MPSPSRQKRAEEAKREKRRSRSRSRRGRSEQKKSHKQESGKSHKRQSSGERESKPEPKACKRQKEEEELEDQDAPAEVAPGSVIISQELLQDWLEEAAYWGSRRALEEAQETLDEQWRCEQEQQQQQKQEALFVEEDVKARPGSSASSGGKWTDAASSRARASTAEVGQKSLRGSSRPTFCSGARPRVSLQPRGKAAPWIRQ